MTPDEYEKLQQIHQLLEEAYAHYFQYESHAKSSEGYISIEYGTLWDRQETGLTITNVHIYSYVFCEDGRTADFPTVDAALDKVKEWHKKELAYDYNAPEEIAAREELDKFAAEFISTLQEKGKLNIIEIHPKDSANQDSNPEEK